jgi:hypothetical protein
MPAFALSDLLWSAAAPPGNEKTRTFSLLHFHARQHSETGATGFSVATARLINRRQDNHQFNSAQLVASSSCGRSPFSVRISKQ